MREQVLQKVVSRDVKDIYGRQAGSVVGYTVDASGGFRSMGIDHGGGLFIEYPADQLIFDDDALVLAPRWRTEVEKLAKLRGTVQRRVQALEQLRVEGEIPQHVYDHMKAQLDEDLVRLQASYGPLKEALEKRSGEMTRKRAQIEKFIASIMVHHRSGEIDDASFESSKAAVAEMLAQDDREQADLRKALQLLSPPEASQVGGA